MKAPREIGAAIGLAILALLLVPWLLIVLPLLLVRGLWDLARRNWLQRVAARRWQGRRVLLVYSDSPNWKDYIERNWLARYRSELVLLNWSERRNWAKRHRFERAVFRAWAGEREFNPIAIGFPAGNGVVVIRFWQAFRDHKHGNSTRLDAAERELEALVQNARSNRGR